MKTLNKIASIILFSILIACGGNDSKKEKTDIYEKRETEQKKEPAQIETKTADSPSDLENKGIGPIKSVDIDESIDANMASHGKEVYNKLCTACHKMEKKFIGPAQSGVTERRSPEWIMNMIMNPEEMIKKDPIAMRLLMESNMAVMANQNVSEEDTRAILEYFREYDKNN